MKYRLKENHPAIKAIEELSEKAKELGISFYFSGISTTVYYNDIGFDFVDNEDNSAMYEFPPIMEYKLIFEKE